MTRLCALLFIISSIDQCFGLRKLSSLYNPPPTVVEYHNGALLEGNLPISIVWYGKFTTAQKSIVSNFLLSHSLQKNSIAFPQSNAFCVTMWKTVDSYIVKAKKKKTHITLPIKSSTTSARSASPLRSPKSPSWQRKRATKVDTIVLTAKDVAVEGFCMSNCGFHGSNAKTNSAYIWVGNSASQCPGQCAWPFHQPIYGPQTPPLVAPNNDVGLDGMVINIASLLAGTVTNPFGKGYFQGPPEAALEVNKVCPGMYGKNAYPGYAGDLLVASTTGASYNAHGVNGRKYLLPSLFDTATSSCSTLV
ncbi:hypothetical protein QJS10_CPB19g01354 [Acorus calamus]|uniref:Phi-1-like phosphate-induced protein n=1 Tax=Acorus calamus TaxID=4465 RepID=A0AAV9CIT3_ACOCL|nr:hypothetical protein QJS10_CPB19g01354 [Acorus calamus]